MSTPPAAPPHDAPSPELDVFDGPFPIPPTIADYIDVEVIWAQYALLMQSVAARMRRRHAVTRDAVAVDPALARRARTLAEHCLLVGFFPEASAEVVALMEKLVERASEPGYGLQTYHLSLLEIFEHQLLGEKLRTDGRFADPRAVTRKVLRLAKKNAPGLHPRLKEPTEQHVSKAVEVMGKLKIAFRRRPAKGTVKPYGAMREFLKAFGLSIPQWPKDAQRKASLG